MSRRQRSVGKCWSHQIQHERPFCYSSSKLRRFLFEIAFQDRAGKPYHAVVRVERGRRALLRSMSCKRSLCHAVRLKQGAVVVRVLQHSHIIACDELVSSSEISCRVSAHTSKYRVQMALQSNSART